MSIEVSTNTVTTSSTSSTTKIESKRVVTINSNAILGGLFKHIEGNTIKVLLGIMAHLDEYGQAFPSQKQLATILGMSEKTVYTHIKKLLEIKVDGDYLIHRDLIPIDVARSYSLYAVNPKILSQDKHSIDVSLQVPIVDDRADILAYVSNPERSKPLVAVDYLKYHKELCYKYLGVTIVPNYKRDCSMIKNKFMSAMPEKELIKTIEFAVANYEERWATATYTVPTIGILASWLLNEASKVMNDERKLEAQSKVDIQDFENENSYFLSL